MRDMVSELQICYLGLQPYAPIHTKMRKFTNQRTAETADEFWCLQHRAVFTLGANADEQHIISKSKIPIVQSDRGGQVTFHGPGQVIIYLLINLRRKSMGIKQLVQHIEQSVVDLLGSYQIMAEARADAHGVYVGDAKIASLGLRVSGGCSYHGVALNVDMDMGPFAQINPCGFPGLAVTQLKDHGVESSCQQIHTELTMQLCKHLHYKSSNIITNVH